MEPGYWQQRWREGRIGFHEGKPNPHLVQHAAVLAIAPERRRVLVPLCGKTVDLAYLAGLGAEVVGVEIVDAAARAFFDEQQIPVARTVDGPLVRYEGAGVEIVVGDFFDLGPEDIGLFDAYYDRASLVALPREMRAAYVRTMQRVTPKARGLVVSFEHDVGDGEPPFSITRADLEGLFPERTFAFLRKRSTFDPSGNMAKRGATFVEETAYAVTTNAT